MVEKGSEEKQTNKCLSLIFEVVAPCEKQRWREDIGEKNPAFAILKYS